MKIGNKQVGLKQMRTGRSRPQGEALSLASRTYEADRNKIARIGYEKLKETVASVGSEMWCKHNPRNECRAGL
jgi:hypothetical protein